MAEPVDIKDRVKDWYFDNPANTIKDAAYEFDLPYETVRDWAQKEAWRVKRIIEGALADLSQDVKAQADNIRLVLFEEIMLGMHDAKDLSELVKSWKSLLSVGEAGEPTDEYVDRDELTELLAHETD